MNGSFNELNQDNDKSDGNFVDSNPTINPFFVESEVKYENLFESELNFGGLSLFRRTDLTPKYVKPLNQIKVSDMDRKEILETNSSGVSFIFRDLTSFI